jgi:hypothetical protein
MYLIAQYMNIVPLVYVKDGKLLDGKDGNQVSTDDLFKRVEKDTMLYVLDLDGIEHGNPALDLYQKLTEHCILWIDDGPRRIDDVMDTIMAGATNITLREDLWPEMDILGVFELTDDEVYFGIISGHTEQPWALSVPQQDIGVVVFSLTSQINSDFIFVSFLKNLALKHKIYLHTVAQNTIPLWEEHGITGILIDLNKKERDRYGF